MKKEVAIKIREEAERLAVEFSNPERGFNYGKETFSLVNINALSENSSVAVYKKSSGKLALFYIQFINTGNGGFIQSFCIKYQHLCDFDIIRQMMAEVERLNFPKNFAETKTNAICPTCNSELIYSKIIHIFYCSKCEYHE